jgi:hypothetical protein
MEHTLYQDGQTARYVLQVISVRSQISTSRLVLQVHTHMMVKSVAHLAHLVLNVLTQKASTS